MRRMMIVQMCVMVMLIGMSMNWGITEFESYQTRLYETLKPQKGGVLRGIHFDMTPQEVLKLEEGNSILINEPHHIGVRAIAKFAYGNEWVNIYYQFEQNKLTTINIQVVNDEIVPAFQFSRSFENFLVEQLGESERTLSGSKIWSTTDPVSGKTYQIQLNNFQENTFAGFFLEYRPI